MTAKTTKITKKGKTAVPLRRGRPEFPDKSQLKRVSMTICLTTEIHAKFREIAISKGIAPATMARQLVEGAVIE